MEQIKQNKKIAVIEPIGGHGGMEYYDYGLCTAAASINNNNVTLFTSDKSNLDSRLQLSYMIKKVFKNIYGKQNIIIRGYRFLFQIFKVYFYCKKNNIDIIHLHLFHFSLLEKTQAIIGKLFGFKIIATIHDIESFDYKHQKNKKDSFIPFLDAIIVHNQFSIKILLDKNPKFKKLEIAVVPPFDRDITITNNISSIHLKEKFGFYQEDRRYILFFGQIKKDKGVDLLIQAFMKLCETEDDVDLIIAGRVWKTDFQEYHKLIYESGYQDRFILKIEYINDELVPYLFNIADVVVLPYKVIYNSSVIFRAMDYNSIILASDLEPLTDIIEDGQNGYIFYSNNIKSLENKLQYILSISDQKKQDILQNIKKTLSNKFSIEATAIPLNKIYKKVLNLD